MEKYVEKQNTAQTILADLESALQPYVTKMEATADEDKKNMLMKIISQVNSSKEKLSELISCGTSSTDDIQAATKVCFSFTVSILGLT
jgi:cysteinyl-tRNA synthetase